MSKVWYWSLSQYRVPKTWKVCLKRHLSCCEIAVFLETQRCKLGAVYIYLKRACYENILRSMFVVVYRIPWRAFYRPKHGASALLPRTPRTNCFRSTDNSPTNSVTIHIVSRPLLITLHLASRSYGHDHIINELSINRFFIARQCPDCVIFGTMVAFQWIVLTLFHVLRTAVSISYVVCVVPKLGVVRLLVLHCPPPKFGCISK